MRKASVTVAISAGDHPHQSAAFAIPNSARTGIRNTNACKCGHHRTSSVLQPIGVPSRHSLPCLSPGPSRLFANLLRHATYRFRKTVCELTVIQPQFAKSLSCIAYVATKSKDEPITHICYNLATFIGFLRPVQLRTSGVVVVRKAFFRAVVSESPALRTLYANGQIAAMGHSTISRR